MAENPHGIPLKDGEHSIWRGYSAVYRLFFDNPWSDPQGEIGIGVAETDQNFDDERSGLPERVDFRCGRA